ncbi:BQ2448_3110 [Microbotryum intermedium]|uniref:BQ2448_3110 protein n=1 Tax=Microbotryum intermedium TaxID=269621 RepID=A0A238FCG4_9BASI|nr:BQ2448_3110 [Microbotryum intermedium]
MPRRLDYVYGDKPEAAGPATTPAVTSVSAVSSVPSSAAQLPEIGGLVRTHSSSGGSHPIASLNSLPSTSSGARPTAPYGAQAPERDYDDYRKKLRRVGIAKVATCLLQQRLQSLTASQRLAISFRALGGSSDRDGSGVPPSISPRPSASPPATTSHAASLRLQELARSLQVQATIQRDRLRERDRVAEQDLRANTAPLARIGATTFSTGPSGSPLVMRVRYTHRSDTGNTIDDAQDWEHSGASEDEDDDDEDDELDGDVITLGDGTVPSEEVLRLWYDARRLETGQVDANGVNKTRRKRHRDTLEGR